MTNRTSNMHPVDQLGVLLAQIADLEGKAKQIKDSLKAEGAGAYEGDLFRATVSVTDRETLDSKAMKAKLQELGVSHQWFTAHTRSTEVATVKVVARISGEQLAA